jgi:hypothetical protein
MLVALALAALGMSAQVEGQWQDFGAGPDGVRIAVNLDSIEAGAAGAEAVVRMRYPRAQAGGATQSDVVTRFSCGDRMVTRLRLVQFGAQGQVVNRPEFAEQMAPVRAAAGTPMGEVLDLVCSMAG